MSIRGILEPFKMASGNAVDQFVYRDKLLNFTKIHQLDNILKIHTNFNFLSQLITFLIKYLDTQNT